MTIIYCILAWIAGVGVILLLWMATVRAAERRNAGRDCRERQHFQDVEAVVSEPFSGEDEWHFQRAFRQYSQERDAS